MAEHPDESEPGNTYAIAGTYASTSGNAPFLVRAAFNISKTTPSEPLSVEKKTEYLERLREAVTSVQDQVNQELTRRMEEDNLKSGQAANGTGDAREEENYGEEEQEAD